MPMARSPVWSPAWHSGWRIWCCHSSGVGRSCGSGLTPGPGTSISCGCGPPQKRYRPVSSCFPSTVIPTFLLAHPLLNSWWSVCCPNDVILLFQECYISGIIFYITFGDWLFSPSIILWGFIQIVLCRVVHSLLLLMSSPWRGCSSLFNDSSTEGHLDCFQFMAINKHLCIGF